MCVIGLIRRKLTREEIKELWESDSHGAGVAWTRNGKVHYKKGFMKLEQFLDFYLNEQLPVPHVVHFRTASAGGVSPSLTHPFLISPSSPLKLSYEGKAPVLFHNGTVALSSLMPLVLQLYIKKGLKLKGEWSDTRALAVLVSTLGTGVLNIFDVDRYAIVYPNRIIHKGLSWEKGGNFYSRPFWQRVVFHNYYSSLFKSKHFGGEDD